MTSFDVRYYLEQPRLYAIIDTMHMHLQYIETQCRKGIYLPAVIVAYIQYKVNKGTCIHVDMTRYICP